MANSPIEEVTTKGRRRIVVVLAVCHLTCVMMGAFQVFKPTGKNAVSRGVALYGAMSGADNAYGFFAPEVGNEARVEFHTEEEVELLTDRFSGEAGFRVGTIIDTFGLHDDVSLRRELATSWGAWFLSNHPKVHTVRIAVAYRLVPTMKQYRAGERPEWKEAYSITVYRKN